MLRRKHPLHHGQLGTTLIEQIVIVVILAILACVAVPALHQVLTGHTLRVAQADLIASLQHARALAVQMGGRILVCPSHNGRQCSSDSHWDDGWLIGKRGEAPNRLDGAPLYVFQRDRRHTTIRSTAGRRRVQFLADGSADGTNISLQICRPGDAAHALVVKISAVGRVRGATASAKEAANCAGNR
jgi:type IV fimbrial biogenesis protein FimT